MGSDARKLAAREYGAQARGAADLRVCEAKSAPALANFERLTARRGKPAPAGCRVPASEPGLRASSSAGLLAFL